DWSDKLSTEVEVGAKLVESRVPPLNGNGFMAATIRTKHPEDMTLPQTGVILLGPDEFRHANELDNDVLHGKVQFNYLKGKHLLTGGIDYELLRVRNLFVPTSNGAAQYDSV